MNEFIWVIRWTEELKLSRNGNECKHLFHTRTLAAGNSSCTPNIPLLHPYCTPNVPLIHPRRRQLERVHAEVHRA